VSAILHSEARPIEPAEVAARFALVVMFLALGLDMGGQAGLRNLLVPVCLVVIVLTKGVGVTRASIAWLGLFVLYPTVSLIIGLDDGAELGVALSQYQGTVLSFVLYLVIRQFDYRFSSDVAFLSLASVAAVAVALFGLMYLGIGYFDAMLARWHEGAAGYFGMRLLGGELFPNIYFKSTLFFVPAFLYLLYRGHWLAAFVCFLGLIAGISKTGIGVCLLVLAVYAVFGFGFWHRIVVLLCLAMAGLLVAMTPIFEVVIGLVSGGGETIDVRAGHIASLWQLFSEDPVALLFGYGLGAEFYSSGAGDFVTNIEVDHLNVIRKYGLFWFIGLLLFVALLVFRAWSSSDPQLRLLGWALLIAFLVSGTNPVLISPMFFVVLSIVLAAVEQRERLRHTE
jgi:hypothetical protein